MLAATVDNIPKEEMESKFRRLEVSSDNERKSINFGKRVMNHAYKAAESGATRAFIEFYYDACLNNFNKFRDL